jgi:hypothetical protein
MEVAEMARGRSLSFLSAGLLAASAALVGLAGAAIAVPPSTAPSVVPGNNGTVKIHDGDTENEPIVANEPQVCTFHVHFFFADAGQSGDWWIESWPPTGDMTTVLSGTYLTGADGEYRTPDSPGTYSLPNGHYKLFWQGDEENLAKDKVFWVSCPDTSESPTASTQVTPTPLESFAGETATPAITASPCATLTIDVSQALVQADFAPTVCATPFESFKGETSTPEGTPPPTGTYEAPARGSMSGFALLLAALFGALGMAAAVAQRRVPAKR